MRNASRYRDIPQAVLSLRANKLGFRATVSPDWTALEPLTLQCVKSANTTGAAARRYPFGA